MRAVAGFLGIPAIFFLQIHQWFAAIISCLLVSGLLFISFSAMRQYLVIEEDGILQVTHQLWILERSRFTRFEDIERIIVVWGRGPILDRYCWPQLLIRGGTKRPLLAISKLAFSVESGGENHVFDTTVDLLRNLIARYGRS